MWFFLEFVLVIPRLCNVIFPRICTGVCTVVFTTVFILECVFPRVWLVIPRVCNVVFPRVLHCAYS